MNFLILNYEKSEYTFYKDFTWEHKLQISTNDSSVTSCVTLRDSNANAIHCEMHPL